MQQIAFFILGILIVLGVASITWMGPGMTAILYTLLRRGKDRILPVLALLIGGPVLMSAVGAVVVDALPVSLTQSGMGLTIIGATVAVLWGGITMLALRSWIIGASYMATMLAVSICTGPDPLVPVLGTNPIMNLHGWLLIAHIAFGSVVVAVSIQRRRHAPKRVMSTCPNCGYPSKDLPSQRCPECGKIIPLTSADGA